MKNTPAFPTAQYADGVRPSGFDNGMTLRDYFAAKAMAAVMPTVMNELKKTRGSIKEAIRLQALSAETCYAVADAMMKAREE
jgi:hypothetical protein